jgi:hypothetical protein
MYPELKEKTSYTQPYLLKRFNKIYEALKNWQQELDDDTLEELNMLWSDYLTHKNTVKQAISWAKAAIISRNLSHNLWKNLMFPNGQFEKFLTFCDVDIKEGKTLWTDKFETLLKEDSESIKDSELNKIYVKLRQEWKTPIEAIKWLPWWDILTTNMMNWSSFLPSNDEILEWSRMWRTDYCLGRINTIIWIIILNEWVDYLNKHFKYADVLRDWAEDILQLTPKYQRDIWYLSEYLWTEDPHQILIYVDDEGEEQDIDPNQMWLQQLWYWIPWLKNITRAYKWDISQIAYEIYFLNYLNTYYNDLKDSWEKEKIAKYIELCNKEYWLSYTILKWLINYSMQLDDKKMEKNVFWEIKKLAEEYPCIKDTLAYQTELNAWNITKINEFIHKKYWDQFDFSDIEEQLWL